MNLARSGSLFSLSRLIFTCIAALCGMGATGSCAQEIPLSEINLPPGFTISVFGQADGVRSMTYSPEGILYVGTRGSKIYAMPDRNRDGRADEVITLRDDLNTPNGVAWRNGDLYVAEISRVLRFSGIDTSLTSPPQPQVVTADFPDDGHHGWKFIRFGPDGKLYVPVGAPCNICLSDEKYAAIFRINPDGSGKELVARGVRNTVGFDWRPGTHELWFTENGRDRMGDDLPPDELNKVEQIGLHFGYPHCHGNDIVDPEFDLPEGCSGFRKPELTFGAHVAALGMRFYTGTNFPESYKNQIFVAEHGSWNRSEPIGYRVMLVKMVNGRATTAEVFADGWLRRNGRAWGRPVDIEQLPDGSLLVSDDKAGVIYRIAYLDKR